MGENGRHRVEEDCTWLQMGRGAPEGAGEGSGRRWVADNESASGGRPATGGDQHRRRLGSSGGDVWHTCPASARSREHLPQLRRVK